MNTANLENLFEEFKRKVEEFSTTKSNRTNLYDYEKGFRAITDEFEKKIFQASIGDVPKSKNKKKL